MAHYEIDPSTHVNNDKQTNNGEQNQNPEQCMNVTKKSENKARHSSGIGDNQSKKQDRLNWMYNHGGISDLLNF